MPFVPVAGILVCLSLMVFLPADTWIRLVVWMLLGVDVYSRYGLRHSHLEAGGAGRRGAGLINVLGLGLALLCILTGFWHQQTAGWESDKTMLTVAAVLGLIHLIYYMLRVWRHAAPRHSVR